MDSRSCHTRSPQPSVIDVLRLRRRRRGITLVTFIIFTPLFLAILALVVDGGLAYARKAQFQVIADIAVLSAVGDLPSGDFDAQDAHVRKRVKQHVLANSMPATFFEVQTIRHPTQDLLMAASVQHKASQGSTFGMFQGISSFGIDIRSVAEITIGDIGGSGKNLAIFGEIIVDANSKVLADSYDSDSAVYNPTHTGADGRAYDRANATIGSNSDANFTGDVSLHGSVYALGDIVVKGSSAYLRGDAIASGVVDAKPAAITGNILSGYPLPSFTPLAATKPPDIEGNNDNDDISGYVDSEALEDDFILRKKGGKGSKVIKIPAGGTYYLKEIDLPSDVDIHVTGNPDVAGPAVLYLDGPVTVNGGIINISSNPKPSHLRFISVADKGAGDIKLTGNGTIYADIYAPQQLADLRGTSVIYGRVFGDRVLFSGTVDFHFDEALDPIEGGVYVPNTSLAQPRLVD